MVRLLPWVGMLPTKRRGEFSDTLSLAHGVSGSPLFDVRFLIRLALSERGFASHGEPALTICF